LTAAIGLLAAVAMQWSILSRYSIGPAPADRVVASRPQVIPTPVPPAINTIQFDANVARSVAAPPAESAPVATAQPVSAAVAVAQPASPPVTAAQPDSAPIADAQPAAPPVATAQAVEPTAVPSPTAEPTAAEAWNALAPQLDAVWGAQPTTAISLLQEFLARYPDYPVAQDKLYAALLAEASELRDAGELSAAVDQAEQAAALLPDRGEASAFLVALTPTPVPVPPETSSAVAVAPQQAAGASSSPAQVRQAPVPTQPPPRPAPTPRPQAPVRSAPAAPAAPPPAALPTKVPFVPPAP
jgi:hypothetical protein